MADDTPLPDAKPPFLRRVRIRGYKSLADCDVTLEPLTVLVGRNGSGKSNFLDALAFTRDVIDLGVAKAIRERRGWKAIRPSAEPDGSIRVEFEFDLQYARGPWLGVYSYEISTQAGMSIGVRSERLVMRHCESDWSFGFDRTDDAVRWNGADRFAAEYGHKIELYRPLTTDYPLLSRIGVEPFHVLAEHLVGSNIFNFSPAEMRRLQPGGNNEGLVANGANFASALAQILYFDPMAADRVTRYLGAVVPGIVALRPQVLDSVNNEETVRFFMNDGREFTASAMSDGTLRSLGCLLAVHQCHYYPGREVGFAGIEEPETALHPAAVNVLVDALDEATLWTQVLLTTHSPELLDNPTIRPSSVRVVEMIDGRTVIGPVDAAGLEVVRLNLNTLGGLEREGGLVPDLDAAARPTTGLAPA